MLKSEIKIINGNPCLYIDDKCTTAMAYTTYFPERNCYEDFVRAGYRIFFVNVSFTLSPINSAVTGFSPFLTGVFENPDCPDYSEFDSEVRKILDLCPDAVIFPRIYVSMPKWWTETHPEDVVKTPKGGFREMLFSENFRKDGCQMLSTIVEHIQNADYSRRIGGWQLCGGQTQEWFHHDMNGSLCENAQEPYKKWVKENYGIDNATLPKPEEYKYNGNTRIDSENAVRYAAFCNLEVAKTIDCFASAVKNKTGNSQIVGVFYGYALQETGTSLLGSYGLRGLLNSENVDFFSSPNAYTHARVFGIDWADMLPVDSIKHHEKLCFIECDIRTCLTTSVEQARPGKYPEGMYSTKGAGSLWVGPPTKELSVMALRKSFCHQLTKSSAIWWFDMWGGWYKDEMMMSELAQMKKLYEHGFCPQVDVLSPQVVLFADEAGYANLPCHSPQMSAVSTLTRTAMGNTGVPYDTYMVEDADKILKNYKAAVFLMPIASVAGERARKLCKELGIAYIIAPEAEGGLTASQLQSFYKDNGIHFYTDNNDVVYVGNGYAALHSEHGGKKRLCLPKACAVKAVFGADYSAEKCDVIEFDLQENATALFSVTIL